MNEAWDLYEGLKMATGRGWMAVVPESDCLRAIEDLNNNATFVAELGTIYQNIRSLSQNFWYCSFNFARREANDIAQAR